jgi:hypothetical protein
MNANEIANAIRTRVNQSKATLSAWRVGLTHDPTKRKQEWKDDRENVDYWMQWTADSLSAAQAVEAHFIEKGMKGGTGGNLSALYTTYVYIF